MYVPTASLFHKLRFLVVALLVIGNIFLLTLIPTIVKANTVDTASTASIHATNEPQPRPVSDDANVVTGGMTAMAYEVGRSLSTLGTVANTSIQTVTSSVLGAATQAGQFVGQTVYTCTSFTVRNLVSGLAFIARIPSNIIGSFSGAPVVSSAIKPEDNTQIPVIDPNASALKATAMLAAVNTPRQETTPEPAATPTHHDDTAIWPIHGAITTLFGVAHWPYQPTHTGLDISDGKASGVTPIFPYRPGKVVEAIHSNTGLGNHIIVDHGSGITSVYGHMASLHVKPGQNVDKATILGYEGSTGASTGTHLHFEIRVNGQPVDPRQHISSPL